MIRGPTSVTRGDGPPVLEIEPGPGRFGAIEVTTRAELFDTARHGAERQAANFYATWSASPLLPAGAYALPTPVWRELRGASRLYYRLWTAASRTMWVDPTVSTPSAQAAAAPFVQISDGGGSGPGAVPPAAAEIDIDGRRYGLECVLWRDFRPGPGASPAGSPLLALIRVSAVDAAPFPPSIDGTRLWVVNGAEVWETDFAGEDRPHAPHQLEKVARGGPRWPPGALVDVVARVVDGVGLGRHIAAPRQPVRRTD